MAFDVHSNFAYGTVVTAPSPATTGTTIVIGTSTFADFPDPGTATAYNCVDWPAGSAPLSSNAEIVSVVGKATNGTLYLARNQESSGTRTIVAGDQFSMNITAKNLTDVEQNVFIPSVPGTDHTAYGLKTSFVSAGSVNFGDVCYIGTAGKAVIVDADAIISSYALVMCADAIATADGTANWLLQGIARDDSWAWAVGSPVYITVTATTGNTLSQTAPTGADDAVVVAGIATHADRMYFAPGFTSIIERT